MSEATISLVNPGALLTLFGTRDQHLRKIRESLGVAVSGRNDRIVIEGEDQAVAQATEVFEQLRDMAGRQGSLAPDEVSQVIAQVTGKINREPAPAIETSRAGRTVRARTPGQARYIEAMRDHDLRVQQAAERRRDRQVLGMDRRQTDSRVGVGMTNHRHGGPPVN